VHDAKVLGQPTAILNFETAVDLAINNRQSGEWPVIVGTSLRLIGIDAIRSVRSANTNWRANHAYPR
jgi:hypothetical protein